MFRAVKAATPGQLHLHPAGDPGGAARLLHPKKKTVGVRIPDHRVAQALLAELGEPLLSSTLLLPGEEEPMTQGWEIKERLDHAGRRGDRLRRLRHRADHGGRPLRRRTEILRRGAGDPARFE